MKQVYSMYLPVKFHIELAQRAVAMLGNKSNSKFYRVGGTRGGQNQFKWEDVKTDKDRDSYLGHSVNAPVGRWQKGKDIYWYTKPSESEKNALEEEKLRMREQDDDLLNQAIGIKPKKRRFVESNLDSTEVKQLLHRGNTQREGSEAEKVKGLGAGEVRVHEHIVRLSAIEKEIMKLKQGNSGDNSLSAQETIIHNSLPENVSSQLHDDNASHNSSSSSEGPRRVKKPKSEKKSKKDKHKHKSHKKEHKHKKESKSSHDS